MLYHACTLKTLKDAVESLIKVCGEDAPVIVQDGDDVILLEYVFVDKELKVVGKEAEDYDCPLEHIKAVQIS